MRKKKIAILVLMLYVISQIFLIFAITIIENPFLRDDTWEKSTKIKTELPQLSFTQTWAPNGTIISTASSSQAGAQICSDGAGGAIITWQDHRSGSNHDIYVQRINSSGNVQWTADGVAICTANNYQYYPQICSDGAGGAIITWQDRRGGSNNDIYAQRIDSSGNVQWTADGVAICTANNDQDRPQICSDGAGGAIITWYDYRSGFGGSNWDIYAQRIDSSGNVQWTADGVAICTASNGQGSSQICSDGAGGAIITWYDYRSGSNNDIYAQRIDPSGNVQWTADGVAICTATNNQFSPQICSDGAGGAIITWQDHRSGSNDDIFAQRINSSGNVQWTADGVAICTASNNQYSPQICSDGAGGAIITWEDRRGGSGYDIYAQRIDSSGNVQWTADGVAICTASIDPNRPQICSGGAGGAIITWQDSRGGLNKDIYAQRIDSSGNVQWTADGVAICTASNRQGYPQICSDGAGGAIITWEDSRSGSYYDIYAQKIVDIPSIYIASPENKTYIAPMSGYYPAVFGFENQLPGVMPNDWIIYQSSGTAYLRTVDELDGHKRVLDFYSGVNGDYCYYEKNLKMNITNGTIEFWFQTTDVSPPTWYSYFILSDGISESERNIRLYIRSGTLTFFNSTDFLLVDSIVPNQWYHLRIDFNMIEDTSTIYLNNVLKLSNVDNYGNGSQINTIHVTNHVNLANTHLYLDAIGYSWDPHYNIGDNLEEGLLLSFENSTFLDWMGYSLDGQAIRTILGNKTFPMPDDGPHTVQVFGNTSIGFMIQSDIRHFSIDTEPPEIIITSPSQNQFIGSEAPNFDISIVEPNLNTTWYTLDDGLINKTFTGFTGTIDQAEWEKLSHGPIRTIRFYANDTFGKEGQAEVIINKDINAPISIISFIPHSGTNIVNRSTTFSLSANDGLESGVLNIRYKVNNSAWTDYTGLFTLSEFPTGDYLVSYYAIDIVGNLEVENTLLVKLVEVTIQEPLPDMTIIILTASIIGGIGLAIAITIILIRKRK